MKIITINRCAECPYFNKMLDGITCGHPNVRICINDINIINKDCPLKEPYIHFEDLKNGYTKAYTASDIKKIIEDKRKLQEELKFEKIINETEIDVEVARLQNELDKATEVIKFIAKLIE